MVRTRTQKKPLRSRTCRYIFVVGGVMSGVGKGITTSSVGAVLQSKGYSVALMKADPYLNVDAGTMNPTEHGEVFVLDSGLETDQDMGNYERFLNKSLPHENYMTNGMIFKYVIDKERALGYHGKCVEPTYHITEEVLRRIEQARKKNNPDFLIVEIGGTIGEYQNAIFLEAARKLKQAHPDHVKFIMVSYLPTPSKLGEMKTKPTQTAVVQMNAHGVSPHMIIARSEQSLDKKRKEKIADMCGVDIDSVISAPDVDSIYQVPVNFEDDGFGKKILSLFGIRPKTGTMDPWRKLVQAIKKPKGEVRIAICGKYFDSGDFTLADAYISIIEGLKISCYHQKLKPVIEWINVKDFEKDPRLLKQLSSYDGVVIPGGFGASGVEGKIMVIEYVRKNNIPFFGICYGMQLMVIEYARHVAGLRDAHTVEVNPKTPFPVIDIMHDQKHHLHQGNYGGTMRLGTYPCMLENKTHARDLYRTDAVDERHRHRYEVNPEYITQLADAGLVFSGKSPDGRLMEIAELPKSVHPFFIGTQFHPEFLARPLAPHPIFSGFITASVQYRKRRNG